MSVISTRGITIGHGAPGVGNTPPASYANIGQLVGIGLPGIEAPAAAAYFLSDQVKKKRAGRLADSPDITLTVDYDPNETELAAIKALITAPDTNNHFFKISFPGDGHDTPGSVVFQGHVTGFAPQEVGNEEDENLQAQITIAISSAPAWTGGTSS